MVYENLQAGIGEQVVGYYEGVYLAGFTHKLEEDTEVLVGEAYLYEF